MLGEKGIGLVEAPRFFFIFRILMVRSGAHGLGYVIRLV